MAFGKGWQTSGSATACLSHTGTRALQDGAGTVRVTYEDCNVNS